MTAEKQDLIEVTESIHNRTLDDKIILAMVMTGMSLQKTISDALQPTGT